MTATETADTAEIVHSPAAPDHRRFPALEGVRAVAVLCVVATHSAYWTGHYFHGSAASLLGHLDVGVPIFFVISGFLLSREWFVAAATGRAPVRTRAYFWRRALRILPLYWLTVTLAFLTLSGNDHVTPGDWVRHFFLVQIYDYGDIREGLSHTWSLCTEVAFYVCLPALAGAVVWLSRRRGWSIASAAVALATVLTVAGVAWTVYVRTHPSDLVLPAQTWLPTNISWFAAGIALAGIHTDLDHHPAAARRWGWAAALGSAPGVCWGAAVSAYLLAVTPLTGTAREGAVTAGQAVVRNVFYLVVSILLVWPVVFGRTETVRWALGNPVARFLGEISYGMFLLHLPLLILMTDVLGYRVFTGSTVALFVATLVVTVPAAALSYRFLERPIMGLRRLVPAHDPARTVRRGSPRSPGAQLSPSEGDVPTSTRRR